MHVEKTSFDYERAFSRNRGLLHQDEQLRLKNATVAIAGVGGVGGGHALALARLGVGGFRLADPDRFSIENMNRQAGAKVSTLGRSKVEVVRDMILDINPEARVVTFEHAVGPSSVDQLLDGAEVLLDGVDFFAIEARRCLFQRARERGIWALTAAPLGFSASLVAFSPAKMSFDRYCGFEPGMTREQQLAAFAVALAPKATHIGYLDLACVDLAAETGPSSSVACELASAMIGTAAMSILLGRRPPPAAPAFQQFDAYRNVHRRGRLWFGGRGPLQRLKRALLLRKIESLVGARALPAPSTV